MFRRVYWVVEWLDNDGRSEVRGVYTSIPNLVRTGLGHPSDRRLRLTLTKLDCECGPFGVWLEPNYEGLAERLQEFVRTEEFSSEQCKSLLDALARETTSSSRIGSANLS